MTFDATILESLELNLICWDGDGDHRRYLLTASAGAGQAGSGFKKNKIPPNLLSHFATFTLSYGAQRLSTLLLTL